MKGHVIWLHTFFFSDNYYYLIYTETLQRNVTVRDTCVKNPSGRIHSHDKPHKKNCRGRT